MPTHSQDTPRPLPDRPDLRHLKNQAKDLFRAGDARSLTDAQFKIARLYGFASWPKLKAHVDSLEEIGQLKHAIDTNDFEGVKTLMSRNPALHGAPLGYNKNGPLTWVAECRVPWEPPSVERLAMAKWMIDNGSDVHQGGDGPLMRAALFGHRIPMMELLVSHGADVNAEWNGYFPILFAPCETVEPTPIKWLLEHGANPNCAKPQRKYPGTALDYVIATYGRSRQLGTCIQLLLDAGGVTKHDVPPVLDLLRGRLDYLAELLDADAANARATVDESGIGGQTALFHAVTQFGDCGLLAAQLLMDHGAYLSVRVRLPRHYERPGEIVECTPLGYALQFPGGENKTVAKLRERGAAE